MCVYSLFVKHVCHLKEFWPNEIRRNKWRKSSDFRERINNTHGGTQMLGERRLWSAGVCMHFGPLERRLWPRCSHVNFEWPPWLKTPPPFHSSQAPRLPLHDIIVEACPPNPCESPHLYSHWASATHTFLSLPLLFSPPSLSLPPLLPPIPSLFP